MPSTIAAISSFWSPKFARPNRNSLLRRKSSRALAFSRPSTESWFPAISARCSALRWKRERLLFEIAPLNSYRLIVHVDERDVRYIAIGQSGTVALAGSPGDPLPLTLSKITPVTVAEEGRNSFRVEARLTELGPQLRPGMEGVAKIETGQRSIVWIWTHAVVDWLRLAAWKYLP